MDVITETSLEALIQRATDPRNKSTDTAAIDAFCGIIKKAPDGALVATKLIALRIQSAQEWEALQGLSVLEECMKNCGPSFHAEIGKFRFLNEMIKLVSPKFLGDRTPPSVRNQVLKLMYTWTVNYPKEPKIKEAYEMLKKQGVLDKEDVMLPAIVCDSKIQQPPKINPIFQDEDKVRLLQKLLHSKNPDDLQAANKLIKTMVREDERRIEVKSKRLTELETVKNNVRLLSEMLDSYRPGCSSCEELDLMKELHQGCERLRPNVYRMAAETHDNEEMLNQVLCASDEMEQVFDKYTAIIVHGRNVKAVASSSKEVSSLLDLSTPAEEKNAVPGMESTSSSADLLSEPVLDLQLGLQSSVPTRPSPQHHLDALGDIFAHFNPQSTILTSSSPILQPCNVTKPSTPSASQDKKSKLKAFEDLDVLGETLLQQCKMDAVLASTKSLELSPALSRSSQKSDNDTIKHNGDGDDALMDLMDDPLMTVEAEVPVEMQVPVETQLPVPEPKLTEALEVRPLTDVLVALETIKPSSIPPASVIEERNGVTVTLHFAQDTPRPDVLVIVVTTISKNSVPLTNYLFQAVVPKGCKVKLQPPSGNTLPAHSPFLPPSAITQIMLIANPNKLPVALKCMISYTMNEETLTEMGEVDSLPVIPSVT